MVTSVVLPYQVYVLTGDLLMLGALSLVQLVPILIFALGGGAIADAVDRRRLLFVTQLGLAATSLALMLLALLPAPPIPAIFAVAFLAAGIGAVDQPARGSAIPRLVPSERLPAAISLNQITFNGAANFAPFFHPDNRRIIFASNVADPQGRDFDLYLINIDGSGLERVTYNETFDGFPMFTHDGRKLVFASNRNGKVPHETNLFLADWRE